MEGRDEAVLQGQAKVWDCMLAFVDSMALKCAVELRIADIINSHGCPISFNQIIQGIKAPSPDINCLFRIMRVLVRKGIFTVNSSGDDALYGLTESSKWLLHDTGLTLAPMVLMENHPMLLTPWHYLSKCVEEGGIAFKKAHGAEIWDLFSSHPELNRVFNEGMACTAKISVRAILDANKDGFEGIGTLVDLGGGTGAMIGDIVEEHPHIKGINFDFPHVVATAPVYPGVEHVGGDMFVSVPNADAVIMKSIMHDWSDGDCVRIFKKCREAIPKKTGKVIIVDIMLQPDGEGVFDNTRLAMDLLMIAHASGGKKGLKLNGRNYLKMEDSPATRLFSFQHCYRSSRHILNKM